MNHSEPQAPLERTAEGAPKDGTMVCLLVDYSGDGSGPLDDAEQAWTIGYNTLADTGDDEWIMVGWDWCQDCYCQGKGRIIGWAPFAPSTAFAAADLDALAGLSDAIDDMRNALCDTGSPHPERVNRALRRVNQIAWGRVQAAMTALRRRPAPVAAAPDEISLPYAVGMARSRLEAAADQMIAGQRDGGMVGGRELKRLLVGAFAEVDAALPTAHSSAGEQ